MEAVTVAGDEPDDREVAERREPVGAPVVRGDPEITGEHAPAAAQFDSDDPESLERAAEVARTFAASIEDTTDQLSMLRGAAACAALVRGLGSYAVAAERAGDPVTVPFLRKWARVHDLPISIRRHIARGDIPPTAATHIARVTGRARFLLAWAVLDEGLSVEQVGQLAGAIKGGQSPDAAFQERGLEPGRLTLTLPESHYRELRRRASLEHVSPSDIVAAALDAWFVEPD